MYEEHEDVMDEEMFIASFNEKGNLYKGSVVTLSELQETTGAYFPPGHYMTALPVSKLIH